MKLAEYLDKKSISKAKFAKEIGCSRQSIYLWISGDERPSFRFLEAIMEKTNGKVTVNDFI